MFGIKVTESGEFLETNDGTISYTVRFPNLKGDNADGSYIFNFTIPATDPNKKRCKFPLRIEAFKAMTTEINIEVYFRGISVWSGTMLAKFARPDDIEVSIGIGRGEFNYLATDKKISDVVPDENHTVGHMEQVTDPASGIVHDMVQITGFDEVVTKVYPEVNYAVAPIKVEDLCASMGEAFNNAYYNTSSNINMWDLQLQRFMRPLLTGNQYLHISTVNEAETHTNHITYLLPYNIFIPYPYNSWVLKNVFKSLGYAIDNNIFETDPDLKRLILYNVQTINELKNSNEGPWTQLTQDWSDETGWGPQYTLTTKRYLYALQPKIQFNLADHVSDVDVKTYLRSLENLFFFRFFIDNKSRKVTIKFLKDIVMSTEYEDITEKVVGITERKMEYDKIATLKQNFDSNDGNGGFIKTKEEVEKLDRINDVWYQGDLPANTFGQFENKRVYGQMQKKWFVCSSFANDFNHVSTWDFFAFEHYCEKRLLAEGKDWTTEASAPACSHFVDYKPGTSFVKYAWHLANTKQALRFYNAYKTDENTCGLRFLFYRGMQKGRIEKYDTLAFCTMGTSQIYIPVFFLHEHSDISMDDAATVCWYIAEGTHTFAEAEAYLRGFYSEDHPIPSAVLGDFFSYYVYTFESVTPFSNEEKLYPLATNDVYDSDLTKIPEANLSLKWDGEYGIYNRFAKDFIYWFNTIAKPVTILIQPTVEDLFMDFSKKKRINGIDYIFDEIRGEIKGDTMSVAEVDAWSC